MAIHLQAALRGERKRDVLRRGTIIAIVSFLTLIDLFGSQALLPRLIDAYGVDAATMGAAVNASTFGMAVAGLLVAYFSDRIDRKRGIWISLALLAIPTFLLGVCDDVTTFAALRIAQGVCMSTAFTLTLTYLSEQCDITAAAGAMSAYITGNVASNLAGRLMAVSFADAFSLEASFFAFAGLNLIGAAFAFLLIGPSSGAPLRDPNRSALRAWRDHLSRPELRMAFLIGFLILFVFLGIFTYVNFVLVDPIYGLSPTQLGLVYFVFLPSIFTTPLAGAWARRYGSRPVFWATFGVALLGAALLATSSLPALLIGLALVGAGTFCAQGVVTGYVGRTAKTDRAAANGLYLTSYYVGGLLGAVVMGQVFDAAGWGATVAVAAAASVAAMFAGRTLKEETAPA